jgi:hypothetical protein
MSGSSGISNANPLARGLALSSLNDTSSGLDRKWARLGSYFLKEPAVRGLEDILASLQVIRTSKILIQLKQILREHALGGWAYHGANRECVQVYPGYNA